MDKISVIVPVYNMEKRISKCLDSLVNQTYNNLEIIVINDGSFDNSLKIINKYKNKYSNIIVVNQKNKGISVARNEGIKKATGKYIGFVDSDDFVALDAYERLYNKIIENDSDIVVCNYRKTNDKQHENIKIKCKLGNIHENPDMIYRMDFGPCNKLYKKDIWHNIKFPVNVKYEDLEAVLKVFLRAKKVCYLNDYLYYYYYNEIGETATINEKVFDIYKILENLNDDFKNETLELKKAYEILCVNKTFDYTFRILNQRNKRLCIKFYNYGYKFLNNHFTNWKKNYLKTSKSLKVILLNFCKIHPLLFKIYIKLK